MNQLSYLLTLACCLIGGFYVGKAFKIITKRLIDRITSICLSLLIFTMGFRVGRTEEVSTNFAQVGLISLSYALATVAGTIITMVIIYQLLKKFRIRYNPASIRQQVGSSSFKDEKSKSSLRTARLKVMAEPLKLLIILICGFIVALFSDIFLKFNGDIITTWILYLLVILIGMSMARNPLKLSDIINHPDLLILPAGTIIGTLGGGLILAFLFEQNIGESLSLAAGFGWYSFSGVILVKLGGPYLGSIAFLTNLLRESIALLIIPVIAHSRYPHIGIAVAGATSMDVTLPIIRLSCGDTAVPLSISHGLIISVAVPFLVPLLYHLG
ncbi:Lysine exporter LysO [subsurface metagenome]